MSRFWTCSAIIPTKPIFGEFQYTLYTFLGYVKTNLFTKSVCHRWSTKECWKSLRNISIVPQLIIGPVCRIQWHRAVWLQYANRWTLNSKYLIYTSNSNYLIDSSETDHTNCRLIGQTSSCKMPVQHGGHSSYKRLILGHENVTILSLRWLYTMKTCYIKSQKSYILLS